MGNELFKNSAQVFNKGKVGTLTWPLQNIDSLLVKPRLDSLAAMIRVVVVLNYPRKWQIISIYSRLIIFKDVSVHSAVHNAFNFQ